MPDFSQRSYEEELMDDLSLEGDALAQNLDEIELINRRLGGNQVVLEALKKMLKNRDPQAPPVEIADLGTGGGDLPRAIVSWARKRKIPVNIVGIDANPFMVSYSQKKAVDFPEIRFEVADIFSPEFQLKRYDICLCSLFCHHFSNEDLITLFQQMQAQSKLGFMVNDLHRHPLAYHSIKFLTWLLRGSYLVRNDAPLSVLRAFKKQELVGLLEQAGISNYSLKWKWAFRYQLIVPAS